MCVKIYYHDEPLRPEQFDTVNHFAARLNEKYQDKKKRLLSFGGIHPDTSDFRKELRLNRKSS